MSLPQQAGETVFQSGSRPEKRKNGKERSSFRRRRKSHLLDKKRWRTNSHERITGPGPGSRQKGIRQVVHRAVGSFAERVQSQRFRSHPNLPPCQRQEFHRYQDDGRCNEGRLQSERADNRSRHG